ncbi:MAG: DUF4139 domain-containing protein [Alphaproteobacteria bacterium]
MSISRPSFYQALLALILPVFFGAAEAAVQQNVTKKNQGPTVLTIFPENLNLTLVLDRRTVHLLEGDTRLSVYQLPKDLIPDSLVLRCLEGSDLEFTEKNFSSKKLTHEGLLEKSIGEQIKVIHVDVRTGEQHTLKGRLLAINGKKSLVDHGNHIALVNSEDIVFEKIPLNFSLQPVMQVRVKAFREKDYRIEFVYLTKGIAWEASYTIDMHPKRNELSMNGWVHLKNTSDVDFTKAKIQLVAPLELAKLPSDMNFHEPNTYPLKNSINLYAGMTKNVAFLSVKNIPVTRSYQIYLPKDIHVNRAGGLLSLPVQIWLSLINSSANGLGIPLPAGNVEIYGRNQKDNPFYIDQTKVDHTPVQASLSFPLGLSSKIKAEMQQTDFRQLGEKVLESAYRVDLTNPTENAVPVVVVQKVEGNWLLSRESHTSQSDERQIRWLLTVPGRQTVSLRYRVRLTDWK